jgi:aspartate kinase
MTEKKILVQKYGGTSVSSAERRKKVVDHVRRALDDGYQVAIVVSAMGRRGDPYATDTLLDLLRLNGGMVNKRDYDMAFVCGEILSTTVMSHLLKCGGIPAVGLTGAQAGIYTNENHSEAEIIEIDPSRLKRHLDGGEVPVIAGCQGAIRDVGDYTTLGRGGSDTSGVALGSALNADKVEIFTDVEGVARADPRVVPHASWLRHINFETMLAMARYGSGVIHPRAVRTGRDEGLPVEVRSTFSTKPGTIINSEPDEYPLVGLSALGSLDPLILDEDILGIKKRVEWEQRRLIMSLVDEDSGVLILGIPSEKSNELASAKVELGSTARDAGKKQSWVSLIGAECREYGSIGRGLLESQGIDVLYHEISNRRHTYIVEAADENRAVQILYDGYFQ